MATIRKRGLRWQVQVRRDGTRPVSKSFVVKDDAVRWARQQELAVDRGELTNKEAEASASFSALLDRYEAVITPTKRSYRSEQAHLRQIRRYFTTTVPITRITSQDIAKFRDKRLIVVCGATVRKEMNILGHLFKVASQEWGYPIKNSVCQSVKKPPNGRPRERRLTECELSKIIASLSLCRNKLILAVFGFALATGMRRSEVLGLYWSHIDWEDSTARLDITKNGERRIVPLSPDALLVLQKRFSEAGGAAMPGDAIFPISANALRLAWERAKKRAGIIDLRFHDLRHEAISRFFEMGLSVPEVSLISGHKDVRMLFRYTHLKPENLASKLRNIGEKCN